MFKCTNNYCILIENVCDGQVDCFDKTYELFCKKVYCPEFLNVVENRDVTWKALAKRQSTHTGFIKQQN